jgi:hypothetical protein
MKLFREGHGKGPDLYKLCLKLNADIKKHARVCHVGMALGVVMMILSNGVGVDFLGAFTVFIFGFYDLVLLKGLDSPVFLKYDMGDGEVWPTREFGWNLNELIELDVYSKIITCDEAQLKSFADTELTARAYKVLMIQNENSGQMQDVKELGVVKKNFQEFFDLMKYFGLIPTTYGYDRYFKQAQGQLEVA